MTQSASILAIEVGSSRVKLGWFPATACTGEKPAGNLPIAAPPLPEPAAVYRIDHRRDERAWIAEVQSRLAELDLPADTHCIVAVVRQAAADALFQHVLSGQPWSSVETLGRSDIDLEVDVAEPSRLGIDRMLNALAANRVRQPQRPAIVVDMGTAITVNSISRDGVFRGGAILAGPMTALEALHHATSSLPRLGREVFAAAPPVIGRSTAEAMASGAYWGAVGAVRQLIERIAETSVEEPDVFLTGGAADAVAPHIGLRDQVARLIPHLVLSGIRLTAAGGTGGV